MRELIVKVLAVSTYVVAVIASAVPLAEVLAQAKFEGPDYASRLGLAMLVSCMAVTSIANTIVGWLGLSCQFWDYITRPCESTLKTARERNAARWRRVMAARYAEERLRELEARTV